jgi:hypothetical protein
LTGFIAGAIAIGGFLGHARPVLKRRDEMAIRVATVLGGLFGLGRAIAAAIGLRIL